MPPDAAPAPPTFYHAGCSEPAPSLPALESRIIEAPACIVGGGLAGLATALSLAERGVAAVLLEAGAIGDGASGRNGGMVSAGFNRGSLALARSHGRERAQALHALSREAMRLMRERIDRFAIACTPVEGVVAASWFAEPETLAAEVEALNAGFGMRLEAWPRERVRELYRTHRYHGAAFDPDGFHLDPLALVRGYARAALARGARLFEASPAIRLEPVREGFRVTTPRGEVTAKRVILCPSGYGDPLAPALRRALLPVVTYVIVTEPLGERLATAIRAPYAVFDDRMATGYYRPLAGGRLLWGGRVGLAERKHDLAGLMRRDLAQVYPQLADVGIEHAWSGRMGFARHKMPMVRLLRPNLWVNTAYGGHGLNGTTMGGELVARAMLEGDRRFELLAPFAPQPVFGLLGRLVAQGIYWGHAARDALHAARPRAAGGPARAGSRGG